MNNKLVFKPQTLTQYNWKKYQVNKDFIYRWEKYYAEPIILKHYFWNKFHVDRNDTFYYWKVYSIDGTYLQEIGSYDRNAYPDNGEILVNFNSYKTVYDRQVKQLDCHCWRVYQDDADKVSKTVRFYKRYEYIPKQTENYYQILEQKFEGSALSQIYFRSRKYYYDLHPSNLWNLTHRNESDYADTWEKYWKPISDADVKRIYGTSSIISFADEEMSSLNYNTTTGKTLGNGIYLDSILNEQGLLEFHTKRPWFTLDNKITFPTGDKTILVNPSYLTFTLSNGGENLYYNSIHFSYSDYYLVPRQQIENGDIYFIELTTSSELWKCFPTIGDDSIEMYVLTHAFKHFPVKKDSERCYCEYDYESEYSKNYPPLSMKDVIQSELDWNSGNTFFKNTIGVPMTDILFQAIIDRDVAYKGGFVYKIEITDKDLLTDTLMNINSEQDSSLTKTENFYKGKYYYEFVKEETTNTITAHHLGNYLYEAHAPTKIYPEATTIPAYHELTGKYYLYCGQGSLDKNYVWKAYTSMDQQPSTYIGEIISSSPTGFPQNGFDVNGAYLNNSAVNYFIFNREEDVDGTKGEFIEEVEENLKIYPDNGIQDNYWYVYNDSKYYSEITGYQISTTTKPPLIGSVTARNQRDAYPDNGVFTLPDGTVEAQYYYVYKDYTVEYSKGSYINNVSSFIRTTYPDDNYVINDGWYVYAGEENIQSAELIVDDTKLMGGVNYIQEVNTSEDLQIGTASSAQVNFTIFANDADATTQYLNKPFEYYKLRNQEWKKIGEFVLTKAEIEGRTTANITGYDFISKFDIVVDDFIENTTFPISLGQFFSNLCEYCGCQAFSTTFPNSTFSVKDNFTATGISGRQILQYIAEVAGGFVVAEPDTKIRIKNYQINDNINLGSSDYIKYNYQLYTTPIITGIVVKKDDEDNGVTNNGN